MHTEGIFHKQLPKGHKHEKGSHQDKDTEDKTYTSHQRKTACMIVCTATVRYHSVTSRAYGVYKPLVISIVASAKISHGVVNVIIMRGIYIVHYLIVVWSSLQTQKFNFTIFFCFFCFFAEENRRMSKYEHPTLMLS